MAFESEIKVAKWLADSLIDVARIPIRLSKYALQVIAVKWLQYEQRQAWRRHVEGTYLDPSARDDSFFPDCRIHH